MFFQSSQPLDFTQKSCLLSNIVTFFFCAVHFFCFVLVQAHAQMFVVSLDFLLPVSQDEDLSASENLHNTGEK